MARIVSKRLRKVVTGESNYCRKCQKNKPPERFYDATDTYLDSNGLFSICIDCIEEMYNLILSNEHSIEATILRMCRMLNVAYVPSAIEAAKVHCETLKNRNGKDVTSFFGIYKAKIKVALRSGMSDNDVDLTYKEVTNITVTKEELTNEYTENATDLISFWGTSDKTDIEFLENEFSNFKKTHKADTYAEVILLKEVCYKLLEINKDRKLGRSINASLKALQEIMKNLAISPNITSAANSGKSIDSFGAWIKEIENTSPAEWVQDKSIYKDVDNIEEYSDKYITSPLRSFVTGNKEFDFETDEDSSTISSEEESSLEE